MREKEKKTDQHNKLAQQVQEKEKTRERERKQYRLYIL
jgi:hypothetical protein